MSEIDNILEKDIKPYKDYILNDTLSELKILCCKSVIINTIQPIEYLILTSYNKINKNLLDNLNDLPLKLPNIKKIYVYWSSNRIIITYKYNKEKKLWTIDMNNFYSRYVNKKYFNINNVDNVKLKLCYKYIKCSNIKNLEIIKSYNIHHFYTCYLTLNNIENINNKLSSKYFIKEYKLNHYKISYRYYYNNENVNINFNKLNSTNNFNNKLFKKFIIDSIIDIMK